MRTLFERAYLPDVGIVDRSIQALAGEAYAANLLTLA
jgi:hypothetical protein